jgi:excinuclease ABC subunit B
MKRAMDEVERRRALQIAYNAAHGITPQTILKPVRDSLEALYEMDYAEVAPLPDEGGKGRTRGQSKGAGKARGVAAGLEDLALMAPAALAQEIERTRGRMLQAAEELRFEEAARERDRLRQLEAQQLRAGI